MGGKGGPPQSCRRGVVRLGAKENPINRRCRRWVRHAAQSNFHRALGALQREPFKGVADAGDDIMPVGSTQAPGRDTADGNLTFSTSVLSGSFTANNSIQPGGIHPLPGQFTGGNGPITGEEVQFNVKFTVPIDLPADHYFLIPQVQVVEPNGNFFWLSAPRPIVPPGTPFPPGFTDLQSWTRDEFLDPDWLRVGTDITHQGPFNATFSLTGLVPEPGTLLLMGVGMGALWWRRKRNC